MDLLDPATRKGLEPSIFGVTGRRDNQLRYRAKQHLQLKPYGAVFENTVTYFSYVSVPSKLHIKLNESDVLFAYLLSLLLKNCLQFLYSSSAAVEQAPRPISTGQLNISLCFHLRPISLSSSRGLTPLGWDISS